MILTEKRDSNGVTCRIIFTLNFATGNATPVVGRCINDSAVLPFYTINGVSSLIYVAS